MLGFPSFKVIDKGQTKPSWFKLSKECFLLHQDLCALCVQIFLSKEVQPELLSNFNL